MYECNTGVDCDQCPGCEIALEEGHDYLEDEESNKESNNSDSNE